MNGYKRVRICGAFLCEKLNMFVYIVNVCMGVQNSDFNISILEYFIVASGIQTIEQASAISRTLSRAKRSEDELDNSVRTLCWFGI